MPFDNLLACEDKRQGSRAPNETFSLFSDFTVKIRQHFLNLNNSRVRHNNTVVQKSRTFLSYDSRIVSFESLRFSFRCKFLWLVFVFKNHSVLLVFFFHAPILEWIVLSVKNLNQKRIWNYWQQFVKSNSLLSSFYTKSISLFY